ncbi:MAG TPA: glycosyltransferase family 1 protein [Candidatus Saccharimonadales bacterium]|nr:glycosyltransferase family 1 protein [Candidatus Saccharimonadales bacterium]
MRGIGYTLINLVNNISSDLRKRHKFVFYYYTDDNSDPLELLDLDGLDYEVRPLVHPKRVHARLPGKFHLVTKLLNKVISLSSMYLGDPRITKTDGIDVFLQSDQMVYPPRGWGMKKVFIAYDLIPYVIEPEYLWNYKTARFRGLPVQAALRCAWRRQSYIHKLRVNSRRADKILAISDTTRDDFIRYVRPSRSKIVTVPLGVNKPRELDDSQPEMHRYVDSSWGYLKRPFRFSKDMDYLLFVGGVDHRRKLGDLVIAFNHLRAQGKDLKLVLAGDILRGPDCIPIRSVQRALKNSSYADDIIFMGFVDDEQRDWLYRNALAFVFPSRYEGFGLPILEAFSYGCPVVCYPNHASKEVAGSHAWYASDAPEIHNMILKLMKSSASQLDKLRRSNKSLAEDYSWQKTVKEMFAEINK